MKIPNIPILNKTIKTTIAAGAILFSPLAIKSNSNTNIQPLLQDKFEYVDSIQAKGTTSTAALMYAPSPVVKIQGSTKIATFVVDLSQNVLYHYNNDGEPICAYLVASGKKSTPTHKGVRIVSHVETYPYKNAPPASKRRRAPRAYGPKIIVLEKLDPKTGEKSLTGEYIHGTNNPSSIGKYASLGCIRMDNEVIKELSKQVKRGDIVIIQ